MRRGTETPQALELIAALAPDVPWQEAYAAVSEALEAAVPFGQTYSTEQLVELIAPADAWIHGAENEARQRVYKALYALSGHRLKSWVTLAKPVQGRFGMMQKKIWRRVPVCSHCCGTGVEPDKNVAPLVEK